MIFRLAVVILVGASGVARAKDRVLFSAGAKALGASAHVKAGASCKIAVTASEPDGCPISCKATVTCGATVLDAGDAFCGELEPGGLDCAVRYKRHVWRAAGPNGTVEVGDGVAMFADGDGAVLFAFTGGRAAGDPEGTSKVRLREPRTPSVDGPFAIAAKTCTVELAAYPDEVWHYCDMKCLAKVTCGAVHVTRTGTCSVPYRYTSNDNQCYGDLEALAFDDGSGATVSLGRQPDDKSDGVFPLWAGAMLTLSK